jgi:hypothetical protein
VRSSVCLAAAALLLLLESRAQAAATADQCVDANDRAQTLRREGHFAAARTQLTTCADASCPRLVRSDCASRLDELDRAQPTIVFDIKDPGGSDVVSAVVEMDGRVLADRLAGTALPIDPGEHTFSLQVPGYRTVARRLVIKEGEKSRRERIVLPAPAPAVSPQRPDPKEAGAPGASGMGTGRVLGLVLGGAGLAAVAVGSVFGALAMSARNAQTSDCGSPTSCPDHLQAVSEHTTFETDGTVSTIAFAAGGALLVGGVVLFFTGAKDAPGRQPAWLLAPAVGRSGTGFTLEARF